MMISRQTGHSSARFIQSGMSLVLTSGPDSTALSGAELGASTVLSFSFFLGCSLEVTPAPSLVDAVPPVPTSSPLAFEDGGVSFEFEAQFSLFCSIFQYWLGWIWQYPLKYKNTLFLLKRIKYINRVVFRLVSDVVFKNCHREFLG